MIVAAWTQPHSLTRLPPRLVEGPCAIETRELTRRLGREIALDGVELQVPGGAVYVLAGPNGAVLRRGGRGREIHWTVWGEERGVAAELARAGAVVREAAPLRLDDAVITLLRSEEPA